MIGVGFTDNPFGLDLPIGARLVSLSPNALNQGDWVYVYTFAPTNVPSGLGPDA